VLTVICEESVTIFANAQVGAADGFFAAVERIVRMLNPNCVPLRKFFN
jgi:hypothetical protein